MHIELSFAQSIYKHSYLFCIHSPHIRMCLSEETLKTGGPFYLVSFPREVKDPTQGVNM